MKRELPFEVVHQFKVEPEKIRVFHARYLKTYRKIWKQLTKLYKVAKKDQARQDHLQRWERIRESDRRYYEFEEHGVWAFGTESMSKLVISVSNSDKTSEK